ncbi:hypothetical protein IV203_000867 [Nitzschia inconspicua]|uniref:Uncharacterized protein n=1 Tax=Nitzschia inconspicua TaxID=303405 RepID=A0A9K3L7H7_9STRA|nr:hypothetical protein IV203_000867 [Nitzschia inconspicua]
MIRGIDKVHAVGVWVFASIYNVFLCVSLVSSLLRPGMSPPRYRSDMSRLTVRNGICCWQFGSCITTTPLYHHPPRSSARRWNGNYQHVSRKWQDVPKSKKMWLNVTTTSTAGAGTTTTATAVTMLLEKKRMESLQHVLTKAVLWKLFYDDYDRMDIECDIGDPDYLPDVVGWNGMEPLPLFWGESGRMKPHKALDLMQRYPHARIVHCRWGMEIDTFARPMLEFLLQQHEEGRLDHPGNWWHGTFTFASLPQDVWRFFDEETGEISVTKEDLEWKDLDINAVLTVK